MTVFDLIDAQNVRARSIAEAIDASDISTALIRSSAEAPLSALNTLLKQSNIPIEINVIENEQIVASKNGGPPYSIAELSDGERNALLIAGDVLTAKPNTLLIIDEPERHLHRSIISPLLSSLFAKRPDCSFVIATHDVDLPLDNEGSRMLLVRSATYSGQHVQSWDADLLDPGTDVSEDIKRDLIGSRRRILFVEGREESLDKPLYSILFPMTSVIAKENCREVMQAVKGLRAASGITWVRAWGIIDGDNHSNDRTDELRRDSIFAVPFYSVESIYYHPWIIRRVADRMAQITSADPELASSTAIEAGIAAVRRNHVRMVKNAATKAARDSVLNSLPTNQTIEARQNVSLNIDVAAILDEKEQALARHLDRKDWAAVVAICPVRESGALAPISKAVGLPSTRDYEASVRTLLSEDAEALSFVRSLFSGAFEEVSAAAR